MIRTVLLVDDHPVVRAACAACSSRARPRGGRRGRLRRRGGRAGAVAAARRGADGPADAGLDGVDATERILAELRARVVVLTTYETDADILRAVEAGAAGYLLKDASRADLADAIRRPRAARPCSRPRWRPGWSAGCARPRRRALSAREVEVLGLVAKGLTNAEIGRELHISEATVKTHLLRAFSKLGVSDRTAAVTTAMARAFWVRP